MRHILRILATVQAKEGIPLNGKHAAPIEKGTALVKVLIALSRKLVWFFFALVRDKRCCTERLPAVMTETA